MEKKMNKLTHTLLIVLLAIFSVFSQIPTRGLVAWFPFNGNYNDESGSGIKLDSAAAGSPTLTADRNGVAKSAYAFNGSRQAFNATQTDKLPSGTSDITINSWALISNAGIPRVITSWGTDTVGQNKEIVFYHTTKSSVLYLGVTNGVDSVESKINNSASSNWMQLAVTVTSSNVKLFLNGALLVSKTMSFNIQAGGIFGIATDWRTANSGTNFFGGTLDDISIYNRALTDQEIAYMYTCKSTKNSAPTITSVAPISVKASAQYLYNVTTSDVDNQTVSVSLSKNPSGMVLTGSKLTWTPTNAQAGKNQVKIIAKDAMGDSTVQNFEITVEPVTSIVNRNITSSITLNNSTRVSYLPNGRICQKNISNGLALSYGIKRIIVK
jgi:hypothetical protein